MGRKIEPRASYYQDAVFLARLQKAVELDDTQSSDWRAAVAGHLNAVAAAFFKHESSRREKKIAK